MHTHSLFLNTFTGNLRIVAYDDIGYQTFIDNEHEDKLFDGSLDECDAEYEKIMVNVEFDKSQSINWIGNISDLHLDEIKLPEEEDISHIFEEYPDFFDNNEIN
jgi:hypothetical protein